MQFQKPTYYCVWFILYTSIWNDDNNSNKKNNKKIIKK